MQSHLERTLRSLHLVSCGLHPMCLTPLFFALYPLTLNLSHENKFTLSFISPSKEIFKHRGGFGDPQYNKQLFQHRLLKRPSSLHWITLGSPSKLHWPGTTLVVQWLRIRLPMQGTQVRALVREDPTCRRATKPLCHNYWSPPRARALQQEKPPQWEARTP